MKKALVVLFGLFLLLQLFPFLVSLSKWTFDASFKPFENSTYYAESAGDVVVHYRFFPSEQDTVKGKVLIIHGLGGSTESFDTNTPALVKAGYDVVAVDLPGFGYSGRSEKLDHSQVGRSKLLWSLLEELDQQANAEVGQMGWHLVGHSMGGGTASAMAVQNGPRTASLTLIDGALTQQTSNTKWLLDYPPFGRWLSVIMEHFLISEKNITKMLTSAYGRPATQEEISDYLAPLEVAGTARGLKNFVETSQSLAMAKLSEYTGPALAIWGESDEWVPKEELKTIKQSLAQMELEIIAGAGHCPNETHSEIFNERLIRFLDASNLANPLD